MLKKIISITLILILIIFTMTGCTDVTNIDDLGYVVALGLDVGESNVIKLSLQISIPGNQKSEDASNSVVNSVECSSLDSGLNLINSFISKEIDLSHCKVIIISEALAEKGISEYIYSLANKVVVRPDTNIIISKCDAEYYLNNSKPLLEKLPARYYELIITSSQYTGYTENVTLSEFFSSIIDTYSEAYAILGGINTKQTHKTDTKNETNIEKDSNYVASQMPSQAGNNVDNIGLVAFKGDKMVGELNGLETIIHLMITNKLETSMISVPNPIKEGNIIDVQVSCRQNTNKVVEIVNGTPFIKIKMKLRANILSMTEEAQYFSYGNIKKIEEYISSYVEYHASELLYRSAKEYKADIFKFGTAAASNFLTWREWEDYNWAENYKNSFFDVEVETMIKSEFLLVET